MSVTSTGSFCIDNTKGLAIDLIAYIRIQTWFLPDNQCGAGKNGGTLKNTRAAREMSVTAFKPSHDIIKEFDTVSRLGL